MADVGVSADDQGSVEVKVEVASSPDPMDSRETPEKNAVAAVDSDQGKDWKAAWGQDETKEMIHLFKTFSQKYPEYSRKNLWNEISLGLKKQGYIKGPERIRNRMKSLRTTFRRVSEYNSTHILKKEFPYLDDLQEVYGMGHVSDDNSSNSGPAMPDEDISMDSSYNISTDGNTSSKKIRLVRTTKKPRVDPEEGYETPIANHPRSSMKRKVVPKKELYPLYQCGLCYGKFTTSQEMHHHRCLGEKQAVNGSPARKKLPQQQQPSTSVSQSQNGKAPFLWNSMSTMKFLELLKEFKIFSRNPSSKNGSLLEELCAIMRRDGLDVATTDLEKKWKNLASAYEKTVIYNKKHQEKKKCAFFNRLTELYKHGASLDMFKLEEAENMTIEVSPFAFSTSNWYDGDEATAAMGYAAGNRMPPRVPRMQHFGGGSSNNNKSNGSTPNGSELVQWLDGFWKEWKELDRRREAANTRRHGELMEVLSFIAENLSK